MGTLWCAKASGQMMTEWTAQPGGPLVSCRTSVSSQEHLPRHWGPGCLLSLLEALCRVSRVKESHACDPDCDPAWDFVISGKRTLCMTQGRGTGIYRPHTRHQVDSGPSAVTLCYGITGFLDFLFLFFFLDTGGSCHLGKGWGAVSRNSFRDDKQSPLTIYQAGPFQKPCFPLGPFPECSSGTPPGPQVRGRYSLWYLEHSSAVLLSAAHQGSCRWRRVPFDSALWCLRLPEWRPTLWSFPPFGQSAGLIKYRSNSSSSPPEYSEQRRHLEHERACITFRRQKHPGREWHGIFWPSK